MLLCMCVCACSSTGSESEAQVLPIADDMPLIDGFIFAIACDVFITQLVTWLLFSGCIGKVTPLLLSRCLSRFRVAVSHIRKSWIYHVVLYYMKCIILLFDYSTHLFIIKF
jgi:hypothetical protein